ncbi:hypothetical protein Halru_2125 [Halovivax ruber XH-70]|uniref:Uncharacterized protein n=1 Tax=Halovivax ruber (strain DSM 18193 / JCM 13892 / XH-70) TaxID=797302 RepID=L0ID72_HALRX|nr:hypothetical protein Halru_2125 [Halovivax ruber XH-70]
MDRTVGHLGQIRSPHLPAEWNGIRFILVWLRKVENGHELIRSDLIGPSRLETRSWLFVVFITELTPC